MSRPTQRHSGPLPLSWWHGLCIQACLCSVSTAPHMWIEHEWASDQVKHSACLFRSLVGKIHRSLSSQRPQFSSTLQSAQHVFLNSSWFNEPLHTLRWSSEYVIVAFLRHKVVVWHYSDDFIGSDSFLHTNTCVHSYCTRSASAVRC